MPKTVVSRMKLTVKIRKISISLLVRRHKRSVVPLLSHTALTKLRVCKLSRLPTFCRALLSLTSCQTAPRMLISLLVRRHKRSVVPLLSRTAFSKLRVFKLYRLPTLCRALLSLTSCQTAPRMLISLLVRRHKRSMVPSLSRTALSKLRVCKLFRLPTLCRPLLSLNSCQTAPRMLIGLLMR